MRIHHGNHDPRIAARHDPRIAARHDPRIAARHDALQDVHAFDGMWRRPADLPLLAASRRRFLFAWASERLPASTGLQLVIRDEGLDANFDSPSGSRADELLASILDWAERRSAADAQDVLAVLALQLEDMLTMGQCPSGRATRLVQVWHALPKDAPIPEARLVRPSP